MLIGSRSFSADEGIVGFKGAEVGSQFRDVDLSTSIDRLGYVFISNIYADGYLLEVDARLDLLL